MNNPIETLATLGQIGQLATRFAGYLRGDTVRPAFGKQPFGQLLNSKYRIKACFRAMGTVLASYANAVNPYDSDSREKQYAFYPKGWKIEPLVNQLELIQLALPRLRCSETFLNRERTVPVGYDGLGLFPKPNALVRELNLTDAYGEGENGADYGKLLEHIFALIKAQRRAHNYRSGALGSEQVWLEDRVRAILQELEAEDPDEDFLVLPVNTGNAYAGRTSRWSCEDMLLADTLPLPALFTAWLIYTNPGRFQTSADLWIDCSGDCYKVGDVVHCLFFDFRDETVSFDGGYLYLALGHCGSASASLSGVAGNL